MYQRAIVCSFQFVALTYLLLLGVANASPTIVVSDGGDLFGVVAAATSGSVIEIHSDETFVGTLTWRDKFLTIKAGDGFAPTIRGADLSAVITGIRGAEGTGGEFVGLQLQAGSGVHFAVELGGNSQSSALIKFRHNQVLGSVVMTGTGEHRFEGIFEENIFSQRVQVGGTGQMIQDIVFHNNTFESGLAISGTGDVKADVRVDRNKILDGMLIGGTGQYSPNLVATNNLLTYASDPFGFGVRINGISSSFPKARFVNNTVVGFKLGLWVDGNAQATFENMLLANQEDVKFDTPLASIANSLIADGTFDQANGNFSATPLFNAQYELMPGSPGIDAGNNMAIGLTEIDLLGRRRIFDGDFDGVAQVDVGAYEAVPEPVGGSIAYGIGIAFYGQVRRRRRT